MSEHTPYPRKYWWAVLVAVPLAAALIAVVPSIMGVLKPSSSPPPVGTFIANARFSNDMYFVTQINGQGGGANSHEAQRQLEQALSLAQEKNYASAIALLQQAVAKYPSAPLYSNLGLLYAYSGDNQKAQEAFQEALKLQPGNQAANLNLGIMLKPTNPAEAATYLAKAPNLTATKPVPPPPQPISPTDHSPVLARSPTQTPGVSAELFEFARFQNTITARVRLINSGAKDQTFPCCGPFYGGYVLDEATGKQYGAIAQSNSGSITLPANVNIEVWAKFSLPAEERPQYLSVVGAYGTHFDNVAVQQKP